jgi:flagellar basal-body rod protein FlgF
MKLGSYAASMAAQTMQKRLDVIANNMANANTTGFKKDDVHFSNFLEQATYTTSREQGPIKDTDGKLDIALEGEGFLRVNSGQEILYTRAGNLTVNADKTLVTQNGWPVLGKNGPIKIEEPSTVRIEPDGQVFDKEQKVDSLDLVQFPPQTNLQKAKHGYFQPAVKDTQPIPAKDCTVKQGALEGANFNMMEEMVRMVDTMRTFEAYQKAIQTFDRDLDGQIITKFAMA